MEMLLKKVEGCLDRTLAKAPVAAFNALIDIKKCTLSVSVVDALTDSLLQAVQDNKGAIEELIIQTAESLLGRGRRYPRLCKATNNGLRRVSHSHTKIKDNNQCACRILRDEIRRLEQMASKGTLRQVLENETDRNAIEGIFKRIDEARKTFQVSPNFLSAYQLAHPSHPARHRLVHRKKGG